MKQTVMWEKLSGGRITGIERVNIEFSDPLSVESLSFNSDWAFLQTYEEVDVKPGEIVKALTMAHKMRNWYTILCTNGLSEGSAERLARYSQVI